MADVKIRVFSEDQTKKELSSVDKGLKALAVGIAAVTAATVLFKKGFEFAEQGAELLLVDRRFQRLAKTINTTAEALSRDLQDAMGGIVSQTEALALGTDLLSLGLVKSSEEASRMAAVVGQLGMDMNQLVLTLTNQTTMRFDALGVSVDGFKDKVKALEESGLSANEAFRLAFLEQAEEQVEKVGDIAETAAGQFRKLRATFKDWMDELKRSIAEAVLPLVESINDTNDAIAVYDEALALNIITQREYVSAMGAQIGENEEFIEGAQDLVGIVNDAKDAIERVAEIPPIDLASKLGIEEIQAELANLPSEEAKSSWKEWSDEAILRAAAVRSWLEAIDFGEITGAEAEDFLNLLEQGGASEEELADATAAIDNFNTAGGNMATAMDNINKEVKPTITVVAQGDTLSDIAAKYGTTIASILNMNPDITDPNLISVGQTITVRSTVSFAGEPTPQAGGGPLTDFSLVGEQGPELIVNGFVIPANQTRKLLAQGLVPGMGFQDGGFLPKRGLKTLSPSAPKPFDPKSAGLFLGDTPPASMISAAPLSGQASATSAAVSVAQSANQISQSGIVQAQQNDQILEVLNGLITPEDLEIAFGTALEQANL